MSFTLAKTGENKRLAFFAGLALAVELLLIFLSGVRIELPAHSHPRVDNPTEVEVISVPEEPPHLKSMSAPEVAPKEETISEKTKTGPSAPALSQPTSNQAVKGRPMSNTHGPVLIESPMPVIPDYLKNKDLSTKVVIEFTVLASGESQPRLVASSGDEELDQLALETARKWKFYPAENDHQAISTTVRLRILFSVK